MSGRLSFLQEAPVYAQLFINIISIPDSASACGNFFRITIDLQGYAYIALLTPAFTYFREIFIYYREEDFLNNFTFWLVTGTAFICAASVGYILGLND
jgi:hypothetical protein